MLTVHRTWFWRDHETRRLAQRLPPLSSTASATGLKFATVRSWNSKLAGRDGERRSKIRRSNIGMFARAHSPESA